MEFNSNSDNTTSINSSSNENNMELINGQKLLLRLFPYINDKSQVSKLQIDTESIHYITVRDDAKKISTIIMNLLNKLHIKSMDAIITDTTACVGGNTISFAKFFKYVYAIEIDSERVKYLKNNISIYELNNVNVINDDFLNIINSINNHNVIFIDPPWGGKSYKDADKLRLCISNISIENICETLMNPNMMAKVPDIIILKLPPNYDITYFYKCLKNNNPIYFYNLEKMIILAIVNKCINLEDDLT